MPIPNLPCLECIVPPQALCLTAPGGVSLCVNLPSLTVPTLSEIARQMFAQINTLIAPLGPVFALMDVVKALGDCVQSVPEAIVKLDPSGLIQCAPVLVEKLAKVAMMFPPLSIPIMLKDAITAIIAFLQGLQEDLQGAQLQLDRILEANTASLLPGNAALIDVVSCARSFYDRVMEHIAAGASPLNRLLGVLNFLVGFLPGVPPLPCIGGLDGLPTYVQTVLEKFITVLKIARSLLPGGLKITPYIPAGANC